VLRRRTRGGGGRVGVEQRRFQLAGPRRERLDGVLALGEQRVDGVQAARQCGDLGAVGLARGVQRLDLGGGRGAPIGHRGGAFAVGLQRRLGARQLVRQRLARGDLAREGLLEGGDRLGTARLFRLERPHVELRRPEDRLRFGGIRARVVAFALVLADQLQRGALVVGHLRQRPFVLGE
jgi:hypothetical protein